MGLRARRRRRSRRRRRKTIRLGLQIEEQQDKVHY
jgi:hypothetical protein